MSLEHPIQFFINGRACSSQARHATPLLDVLRDEFGLTGARPGCRAGACGSCHVLVDGRSVAACDTPLSAAAGRDVLTPEGLPEAIAEAFFKEQAAQCGYCSSGMMIAAAALLRENPLPDEHAIRVALDRHLCRCGAHPRIIRAVARAAAMLRGERPINQRGRSPESSLSALMQTGGEARDGLHGEWPSGGRPGASAGEAPDTARVGASPAPSLPAALLRYPRPSQWLGVDAGGDILLRSGKVEIGQGIQTALAMIVAESLAWPLDRIRVIHASTDTHPDEGVTSGSLSIQESGSALRAVATTLRKRLCDTVARQPGYGAARVTLEAGRFVVVSGLPAEARLPDAGGLLARLLADGQIDQPIIEWPAGQASLAQDIQDRSQPRRELRELFAARGDTFLQDRVIAPMLHGRVIHPPSPHYRLSHAALARLPGLLIELSELPGVQDAWQDGALLGVLADSWHAANSAGQRLHDALEWTGPVNGPGEGQASRPALGTETSLAPVLPDDWPQRSSTAQLIGEHPPQPLAQPYGAADPPASRADAMRTERALPRALRARYTRPWIAHASIGPSCALARWRVRDTLATSDIPDVTGTPGIVEGVGTAVAGPAQSPAPSLEVWTHSQGIFGLRRDLAMAFNLAETAIVVRHVPGAGCYGHNAADDVAFDAAWLARRVPGTTVRLLWTREDEFSKAPLGPAMHIELSAEIDEGGEVLEWRHELWSPGHSTRPGRSSTPALLGNAERDGGHPLPEAIDMPLAVGGGAERNALPAYNFPRWTVLAHRVRTAWRSSALRSLGAFGNVFAAESFVDELALAGGHCPLQWRLRRLSHDARARAVLRAAADHVGWQPGDATRGVDRVSAPEGTGRGLGFARYKNTGAWCAVIADIEAQASLQITRLTIAVDVGRAINPDGVVQQIEGGALQASSWTLKEAIMPGPDGRPGATSWNDLPILRFSEVPAIDVLVLPSAATPLGAGEASIGPTAAAIANALAYGLGVRVRSLPLTPEHIVAAMQT